MNDPPFIIMGVPVPIIDDQEVWRAHEVCAMITPETWVDEIAGERRVFGIDAIDKDRWGLVRIDYNSHNSLSLTHITRNVVHVRLPKPSPMALLFNVLKGNARERFMFLVPKRDYQVYSIGC